MTKIDLEQLAAEMRVMNRRQKLYQVIKGVLKDRKLWKDNPRGLHIKGQMTVKKNREDMNDD